MTSDEVANLKVVLLGNSGCGKTALITRWMSGEFLAQSRPTIGSNHQRKRVFLEKSGEVDLYVWDTAGQEQFQALMPLYARQAKVAIITTAINDERSIDAIPQWIDILQSSCDVPPPVILAVNKMDVSEGAKLSIDDVHQRVQSESLIRNTFFVSALSGENVDQLFKAAAEEAAAFAATMDNHDEAAMPQSEPGKRKLCC